MAEARPWPWATYAVIAANVAMFVVELAHGASPTSPTAQQLVELGASVPPLTLGGQWWRLVSSMFLHFGILHIAVNMVCLYQGQIVEQLFGRTGFLVIYFIAGLGGGIATLLVGDPHGASAGASGAVFGVYGAFGAFLVLRRSQMDPDAWRRTARSIGQFLVLNLVIGLAASGISLSAHVGGLVTGFAVAAGLLVGPGFAPQRPRRAALLAAVGLALTAASVIALGREAIPAVVGEFETVERAAVARLKDAEALAQAARVTPPQQADIIARDVVVPYQQVRPRIAAATTLASERMRPLLQRLDAYVAARIATLELYETWLRETDPQKRAAALGALNARGDELEPLAKAYEAEVERLDAR